jgi:hypothetical protein
VVIMCERSLNQRASIRTVHVFEIASTLLIVTAGRTGRLQLEAPKFNHQTPKKHQNSAR